MTLEIELLRRAKLLIDEARKRQADSGKSLGGRHDLDVKTQQAITNQYQEDSLLKLTLSDPVEPFVAATNVFERFEELCRRQKMSIPSELREPAYRMLALELAVNAKLLGLSLKKAVPFTISNGSVQPLLSDDRFAEFRETPGIFKHAATQYPGPGKAEAFLNAVKECVQSLATDERFAGFRDTPGIFKQAAVGHPAQGQAERFLLGVQERVQSLAIDERFAEFRETPWILRHAATHFPGKVEAFLIGVQERIQALTSDDRFAEFRETPGIFKHAAVHYPSSGKAVDYLLELSGAIRGGNLTLQQARVMTIGQRTAFIE